MMPALAVMGPPCVALLRYVLREIPGRKRGRMASCCQTARGACTLGPVVFRMDSASVNLSDHPAAPPVALRARRGPCVMAHADALGGAPVPSSLGLEGDRHVHAQAACSPQRSTGLE